MCAIVLSFGSLPVVFFLFFFLFYVSHLSVCVLVFCPLSALLSLVYFLWLTACVSIKFGFCDFSLSSHLSLFFQVNDRNLIVMINRTLCWSLRISGGGWGKKLHMTFPLFFKIVTVFRSNIIPDWVTQRCAVLCFSVNEIMHSQTVYESAGGGWGYMETLDRFWPQVD